MPLPPYYLEVILVGGMACLVAVVMNSKRGLQVLFVSFTKGETNRFPLCTHHHSLGPHIGTSRWHHFGWPLVLCPWGDQQVFDGSATFEVSLDAISTTDLFDTSTKTLCVGYANVPFVLHFMVSRLGIVGAPIINLSGRLVESFLHLVQSPLGIFALSESLPEVILFLLEQLRIAAHSRGPMGEGLDNTELGWEVMVAVPM